MFKVSELIKACKAELLSGSPDTAISGISTDTRTLKAGECFIAIKGDNFDGHDFIARAVEKGAACVITDRRPKTIDHRLQTTDQRPLVIIRTRDTVKALGDIASFHRRKFNIPVIAVTGSNGKTTTKEMLAWALSARLDVLKSEGTKNNHIGLPLTLLKLNAQHQAAVVELGTNHFGEIDYLAKIASPNIAIITNIGPSHLEHLKDAAGVFREKSSLIRNLQKPHLAILNADDAFLQKEINKKKSATVFTFGVKNQADFRAADINHLHGRLEFKVNKKYPFSTDTFGHYNTYNALAAIAACRVLGLDYKDIAGKLSSFEFPPGRLNFIELNKIKFIDDTYNSNPLSLGHALDVLGKFSSSGRRILVIGDMLELGSLSHDFHARAGKKAAVSCDVCIAVGALAQEAAEALKEHGFDLGNLFTCETSLQAREILLERVEPQENDVVLVKGSRAMRMEEVIKVLTD